MVCRVEQIKRLDENGVEYWSARNLSKVLEYLEYRNFQPAIERAKEACQNSGQDVADHFVDIHEMITIGKGEMPDFDPKSFLLSPLQLHFCNLT